MGGGARSPLWTQILADVFDRPLEVCASGEVSALGAAAIALTAIGHFGSIPEAAAALARTDTVVEPRVAEAAEYARLRALYQRLYTETHDLLHSLHDLGRHDDTRGEQR